jgi:antitoxin component HigA of HigAB toxin-antitoxin module
MSMDIKSIKTEEDYRATLSEIESLMTAEPDTPEGERLDVLATLVEAYERKHFPMDLPDPVEAIKFVMDQRGLTGLGQRLLERMSGRATSGMSIEEIMALSRGES